MTEIQLPYLPSAQFFKILCRLGINEKDVIWDSDGNPQIRTIGGTVSISSSIPRFRYTEADGRKRVVYTKTETYNIQTSTGELFDADGNIGVSLLNTNSPQMDPQGWTYRATVRPNGGEPFDVPIPSDPEGGVFDLGDGLVFTPSTGITTLETRVKALEDAQSGAPGLPVNFNESVQDIVGAMVAGAGGTYNDAAGTIALPGGGSSTITADDTPAAPAEGESASYLVTSAASWPAGLVWSTDPDGGVAPTITGTALVSMFTVDGVTRAIVGATFQGVVVPDTTTPVAGTLASSAITSSGFTLTVTGASDAGGLHATPYAYSTDNGSTWSAWRAGATYNATGLTAETTYTCTHKVRDAAANETTGTSITVDTTAASGSTWIDTFSDGTGTAEPAGWTKRYTAPTTGTYTEKAGYLDIQRSAAGRSAITLDAANGTGDVDALIKARYRNVPVDAPTTFLQGILVGGSGDVASEDCIVVFARGGAIPIRALQYDAGTYTELGTGGSGGPIGIDSWWWIRVNYAAGQLKARFWMDGAAEPSTWHINAAAGVKVGWVGIWDNCPSGRRLEVDYFSASTAGSAPTP